MFTQPNCQLECPSRKHLHIRTQVAFCLQSSRGQKRDRLRWEHRVTVFYSSHFFLTAIDTNGAKERMRKEAVQATSSRVSS